LLLILICLGNPGERYAGTRHNAAWLFAEHLRAAHGFGEFRPLAGVEALCAEGRFAGVRTCLVEPNTGMNDCGRILPLLFARFDPAEHVYAVAHDDLDVPLGSVKGREKGSHGGHNGVRSLLSAAGKAQLFRLKLGVGSPGKGQYASVADFLLSPFEPKERERLEAAFPKAEQILAVHVKSRLAQAARRAGREELAARYASGPLDAARRALEGIGPVSPYPIFLTKSEAARAFDVTTAIAKLVRKAMRLAAEDEEFRSRLLDFIPARLHRVLRPGVGASRFFFAADFHLSNGRMKVIELNCAVGYAHYARLADEALWPVVSGLSPALGRPVETEFADFLYLHGLKPMHEPQAGGIAFLRGFNDRDMFNVGELEALAARIGASHGLSIPLCHERDLSLTDDGLHLADGGRVDVLYVEENLGDWAAVSEDSPLWRAVCGGLVKTFPPLDMFLYTNKGFLSVLVDPSVERWLEPDEEEAKVLRRNLLWSQPLDGRIEPAAYYMLEQGLTLVLKETLGGGGRGVVVLRPEAASQQAGHTLRSRLREGHSVVQGYFPPGRWSADSDLHFDVRVLVAGGESEITIGPVYGRVWRGEKVDLSAPDAGVAPVYVTG